MYSFNHLAIAKDIFEDLGFEVSFRETPELDSRAYYAQLQLKSKADAQHNLKGILDLRLEEAENEVFYRKSLEHFKTYTVSKFTRV